MNDDPDSFNTFPAQVDGFWECTLALLANPQRWQKFDDGATPEGNPELLWAIAEELPAFAFDLLKYTIPAELCSAAFGCKKFIRPAIGL
jgi:hypothetical protein